MHANYKTLKRAARKPNKKKKNKEEVKKRQPMRWAEGGSSEK